jgi:pimeloyl-ACP methyl ester carboxylesterase
MAYPAYSTEGFERFSVSVGRTDGDRGKSGGAANGDDAGTGKVETVIYTIGRGPTVVYFHGGGTFHGFEWARDWADTFRVVLPHHPNFGESGDADFASARDYAAHYARVFAALGLERFHLVAASMGGLIGVEYAALEPGRLDRLVLVTPAGLISPTVPPPDFSGVAPEDVPGLFVRDRAFIDVFWPREPGPELRALLAREGEAAARLRNFTPAGDAQVRQLAGAIRVPTLLLWGDRDRVLGFGLLEEWRRAMPDAEAIVITGGGHLLLDEFAASREAAREFLLRA